MTTAELTAPGLLGRYLRPHAGRVTLLAALLLLGIATQLAVPQALRSFVDATQSGAGATGALGAALAFIALAIVQRLAGFTASYLGEDLGWRATNRLRGDLTSHCLRLDMGFHKTHTPGELTARIDGDCAALGNFFSQFSLRVLGNGLLAIGILAVLLSEDWRVGLGLGLYAAATLAALFALQRVAVGRWKAYRETITAQFSFLEERMAGTEDIRASGAEAHTLARLGRLTHELVVRRRAADLATNLIFTGTNFLFLFGYALGLAIGAWLYTSGQASIGTAFMIVYYIGMLAAPLETIREQFQDLQQAGASIGRIGELLAHQPRMQEHGGERLPAGPLSAVFEGVTFAYNDDGRWTIEDGRAAGATPTQVEQTSGAEPEAAAQHRALHDISFALEPGRVLGLLGRTGSGKTTLSRLVARLYDPDSGAVRLGGVDVRNVPVAELRARVGVVTQDVQIFQASIRENLTLFRPEISDAQIERALAELELLEWVRGLPEGLDTPLGAGGLGMSAGEAQLLAFARVFLRDPGLIVLDEASSRLDPLTERLLERAVGRLLAGRTAIIIAHRLRTIQRADDILILERGAVLERGPRAALAADPGSHFANLLRVGMEEELA